MTRTKRVSIVTAILLLVATFALMLASAFESGKESTAADAPSVTVTAGESGKLELIKANDTTDFQIAYASELQKEQDFATELRNVFDDAGVNIPSRRYDSKKMDYEILIGKTDRQESQDFYAEVLAKKKNSDDLVWGYAVKGTKVVFVANTIEAFDLGKEEFKKAITDADFALDTDLKVIRVKTMEEYEADVEAQKEALKQKRIEELKAMNALISQEKIFNGYKRVFDKNRNNVVYGNFIDYEYSPYRTMLGDSLDTAWNTESSYPKPWVYPTEDQHPRYLVTASDVKNIREMMNDPEYAKLFEKLWYWAEYDIKDGIFPEKTGKSGETYRYDESILAGISARAMAYLITGDEIYAYEAIVGIKNVMVYIEYTSDIHMDIYHGASHAMTVLAAVYDWCYDVLTETDKQNMIEGAVQSLWPSMEFNYPPVKPQETSYNGISGHGTGPQFLRDYMTLAVVFYDEAPDWYEMVAGRYFYEYLPVANEQYVNGWISQGTACYAPIKLMVQLWAANLLNVCTGENFFTEDAALSIQMFISQIQPNGKYFQTGDGGRNTVGATPGFAEYFVSAALFNDPIAAIWAKYLSNDYTRFDYGSIFTMTPDLQIAFLSRVTKEKEEDKYDSIGLVQYFLDPAGQMTARNSWESDAAAVFMKVGNMSGANHDVYEHGTFQIYYKGLLAADSGSYKHYGGDSHYYYLQCTVAHNGLLVFNPAKAKPADLGSLIVKCKYPGTYCSHEACPVTYDEATGTEVVDCLREGKKCDHKACEWTYDIKNPGAYYYSGSQHRLDSPGSLVQWKDGSYRMAETMGAAWGYNADGSTKYAYIAGDITDAYDDITVDYVGRRMLTIYTGREDIPMLFVTFDELTSDKDYFEKTFLLHTVNEPEVDAEKMTATITAYQNDEEGGKLVLQSLYGANVIEKIGGEGKAYWINGYFADPNDIGSWDEATQTFLDPSDKGSWQDGKNCLDEYTLDDSYYSIWGRVQLRTGAAYREKTTNMLTAMYVTDADSSASLDIQKFKNDKVYGLLADNNVAAFYVGNEKAYLEFSFDSNEIGTNKGLYNYYISGVEDGTWQIFVDGVSVAYSLSSDASGFITFVAPAGTVELKPCADVIGANGGKIQYITGGAAMPEGTPYAYTNDKTVTLPTEITRGEDRFLGWYLTSEFRPEDRVYEVPEGQTGTFKVYAKWLSTYISEDYSDLDISVFQNNATYNRIQYAGSGKTGSSFITYGEGANRYLEWTEGSSDSFIHAQNTANNISTSAAEDKCITYTLELSPKPGASNLVSTFMIIAKRTVDGAEINSQNIPIFKTDAKGQVLLGGRTRIATLQEGKITTVKIVLDFKYNQIIAYDENDDYKASVALTIPSATGAQNGEELMKCLTQYLFYWHGDTPSNVSDAAIRIYSMRMEDGNAFEGDGGEITPRSIVYDKNGGRLPKTTPYSYSKTSPTMLPDPIKTGATFLGWYTTPTFDAGTRVAYVPTTQNETFYVYAKWMELPVSENYEGVDIAIGESSSASSGQISYNAGSETEKKPGSSFYTETDTTGNAYLKASVGSVNAILYHASNNFNLTHFTETAISYEIDLKKIRDIPFPNISYSIATSGGKYGTLNVFKVDKDGNAKLQGSSKVFATVGEDSWTTLRVVVDFAAGAFLAYDADGNVLDKVENVAVPQKGSSTAEEQPATLLEWQKVASSYLLYMALNKGDTALGEIFSVAVDNIHVGHGNIFIKEEIQGTVIKYNVGGGTMPGGAPAFYDAENGTDISGIVPTRDGYVFKGWYTNSLFTGEAVSVVGQGEETLITLYAKWAIRPDTIFYYLNGGTLSGAYPLYYDAVGGTLLPAPTHKELVFDGWYYDADLTNPVVGGILGVGGTEPISVYAKWKIAPDTLILELGGGTVNGAVPEKYNPVTGTLLPTDVTREFYTFGGWYYDAEFTRPIAAGEIVGVGGTEPLTVYAKWNIPNNALFFETFDGVFATTPPSEYSTVDGLVLPTDITKEGHIFAGWYLDADYSGERVDYITYGKTEGIVLFAKWLKVLTDEDYTGDDFEYAETAGQPEREGIVYNTQKPGQGVTVKTVDVNGNTCISIVTEKSGPDTNSVIRTTNSVTNINTIRETSITFMFSWAKIKDMPLSLASLSLQSSSSVGGTGSLAMLESDKDGNVKLSGSSVVLATLEEEVFSDFIIYVDFAAGTVNALRADGSVIDTVTPKAPTGFTSLLEWQKATNGLKHHILFMSISNPNAADSGIATGILLDNIKIVEGSTFITFDKELPVRNTLSYETLGGTLSSDAPTTYDPENGTSLESVIPERAGYEFIGWFLNADLTGNPVTSIGAGENYPITLYAGWRMLTNLIKYETNGGTLGSGVSNLYDKENGSLLTSSVTRPGYVFGGWYREAELVNRVYYVPAGYDKPFTVYAKWLKVIAEEDYTDQSINIENGKMPQFGDFTYNSLNGGVTQKTETEDGNVYLKMANSGTSNGVVQYSIGGLQLLSETAVSYRIDLKKLAGETLANVNFNLMTPSADNVGSASVFSLSGASGEVKLAGSGKAIATVGESKFETLLITIDFADGMIYAYDGEYNVIDSVALKVPTGQGTALEWQAKIRTYSFYLSMTKPSGAGSASLAVDNIQIIDGRAYEKVDVTIPAKNSIEYVTGGGVFTTTPPATYDKENGTVLPTDITLEGFVFDGWYTTPTFDEGTKVESIGKGEGMMVTVYAKWKTVTNKIIYETSGGKVAVSAPTLYDEENGTLLPTAATRDGFVFGGWYREAELVNRVYYVPAGSDAPFTVYAKWLKVLTDETYTGKEFELDESQPERDKIYYNVQAKDDGVTVKTVDINGNTCLRVDTPKTGANTNVVIRTTDSNVNINTIEATSITFMFSWAKIKDVAHPTASLNLESSSGVGGTGRLTLLTTDSAGNVKLVGGTVVLATLEEEIFSDFIIYVDFAAGTVNALRADGSVIDTVTPKAPTGFTSLLEWQKAPNGLKHHILFMNIVNPNSASGIATGLYVDNIKIVEGRAVEKIDVTIPPRNSIEYVTDGGVFTTTPPATYDKENGTVLPTDLTREGYEFDGWYTTPTFDEGTKVDSIGVGGTKAITVYAKWKFVTNKIIYETSGGKVAASAPTLYDEENGTLLPTAATRDGFVFGGWYSDASLTTRVYYVPAGYDKPFTVYAKWLSIVMKEDYSTSTVNKPDGEASGPFLYNAQSVGSGVSLVTCEEAGNKYIKASVNAASNAIIYNYGTAYGLQNFAETAVSYRIDLKKLKDDNLSLAKLMIQTPGNEAGSALIFQMSGKTGEVKLNGSGNVFATVGEDAYTEIRVTVDFASGMVYAYDGEYNVIDSAALQVPAGQGTALEWKANIRTYSFYLSFHRESGDETSSAAVDNLMIVDGRAYEKVNVTIPPRNSIEYVTDGGVFATTPPATYDKENGTVLPTDLTREGYEFDGWYTTPTFDAGSKVDSIGARGTKAITVYAKWKPQSHIINYEISGGKLPSDAPLKYDGQNETALPAGATRDGYVFGGWYSDAALTERIYAVPAGNGEAYTVYAKWLTVLAAEDYTNKDFTIEGETVGKGDFSYNAVNEGMSHTVTSDANSNSYVVTTVGSSANAVIYRHNTTSNIATFKENAVTYKVSFKKLAGETLSNVNFLILTPGEANGKLTALTLDGATGQMKVNGADGSVILTKNGAAVTVGEDAFTTVIFTLDFENAKVTAYDEDGTVLATAPVAVPVVGGVVTADSLLDWQRNKVGPYSLYMNVTGNGTKIATDNIQIIDGRVFAD